ncbi:MAG: SLC13 family permease [Myxococcota bacterium]
MTVPAEAPRPWVVKKPALGLAAGLFFILVASPTGLEPSAHRLLAIFAAIVVLWVSEALPIPVTALLIAPALVAANITTAKAAFAPYADPLLFLFVGGFFIARAMGRHRLDRRIASALLTRAKGEGLTAAFYGAAALLSMWISNTASAAVLAPILLGALRSREKPAAAPMLGLAYACSVGGLGTLVGSPPNGITARLLNERLEADGLSFGFAEWSMVGLPAAVLLLVLVSWITLRVAPRVAPRSNGSEPGSAGETVPTHPQPVSTGWSRGERVTALSLLLAVSAWLGTGLWKASGSELGLSVAAALPGGAIAILACVPLFLLRDEKGDAVLPWNDAAQIDWGIILLFGGGISLGSQMFETGLARAMAVAFVDLTGIEGLWMLTALVAVLTIFFTEACSNTASATMLVPLVIAIADELGVSPVPPALAVGLAASCAFVLPIATGPNAIVYGTGVIPLRTMMRTGLVLNVVSALAIVVLLRMLVTAYGW